MPLSDVSNAIAYYLAPENSNIANLGVVYQALPKVSDESQLFTNTFPGLGIGATIYMFFTSQKESRIAFGGQHDGRKYRVYDLGFLICFKSDLPQTYDGQIAYNEFIDNLTNYIQADRNAGTEAVALGGNGPYAGTGVVFQWGEGAGPNGGGDDLVFEHLVPRTTDGGVTLFQSVGRISVVEIMNT